MLYRQTRPISVPRDVLTAVLYGRTIRASRTPHASHASHTTDEPPGRSSHSRLKAARSGQVAAASVLATPWLVYAGLFFGHAAAAAALGTGLLLALGPLEPGAAPVAGRKPFIGGLLLGLAVLVGVLVGCLASIAIIWSWSPVGPGPGAAILITLAGVAVALWGFLFPVRSYLGRAVAAGSLLGAATLTRILPMMTTAAGTLAPARAFVIGAGVAGLQAIATARRLGAVVSAFDVRPAVKEQVQSLGATFVEVPQVAAEGAGGYAKELGVDQAKFDACLDGGEKAKLVEADKKAGEEVGVTGTPAFFINGVLLSGAQPLEAFSQVIDAELKTPQVAAK